MPQETQTLLAFLLVIGNCVVAGFFSHMYLILLIMMCLCLQYNVD